MPGGSATDERGRLDIAAQRPNLARATIDQRKIPST